MFTLVQPKNPIQALVEAAQILPPGADLRDLYNRYVGRPWRERLRMRRLLSLDNVPMLETNVLFAMPEAWSGGKNFSYTTDNLPLVAFAKIGWSRVFFNDGRLGRNLRGRYLQASRDNTRSIHASAVPPIPAEVLKNRPLFENHHVLFDASWNEYQRKVDPATLDPYLLTRVDEHRFKVIGHWDISEQERRLIALMGL